MRCDAIRGQDEEEEEEEEEEEGERCSARPFMLFLENIAFSVGLNDKGKGDPFLFSFFRLHGALGSSWAEGTRRYRSSPPPF